MSSQVFYRKWRPQSLSEVAGQEQVTQTLLNALSSGRLSHAYLFCGPRGTGKTSTGRILAKAVNCLTNGKGEPCNTCAMCRAITEGRALDVIEMDAASNRGIADARELKERVRYAPNEARFKVYIIDEVHMLTTEAANALLKTLEEPPPRVIFILATTDPHDLLPTIISRCQRFDFHRIAPSDVAGKLSEICGKEGIKIDAEGLRLITRSAQGSLRDAENVLEQLATFYGKEISRGQVLKMLGVSEDARTRELVRYIVEGNVAAGIMTVSSINADGLDLRQFNRELVSYLRGLLLIKTGAAEGLDMSGEDIALLRELAEKASLSQVLRSLKIFGGLEFGTDGNSALPLELALVDTVLAPEEKPAARAPVEAPKAEPRTVRPPTERPVVRPSGAASVAPAAKPAPVTTPPEPIAKPPAANVAPPVSAPKPVVSEPVKEVVPEQPKEPATELDRLRLNWKIVIAQAPPDTQRSNAIAVLRSAGAKVAAIEGNTIVLAFKYQNFVDRISLPENIKVTEKIVGNYLGRPVRVRCTLEQAPNHLIEEAQRLGARITEEK
jgi:DNA polymerase-3 subunit gamma/tau